VLALSVMAIAHPIEQRLMPSRAGT